MNSQQQINPSVEAMAALKAIAGSNPPCWIMPLSVYKNGWHEKIGARLIARDDYGPTVVQWCGHYYIRRVGNKKYGIDIWFSRAGGKDSDGENQYLTLIKFRQNAIPHAEPLPQYVIEALQPNT